MSRACIARHPLLLEAGRVLRGPRRRSCGRRLVDRASRRSSSRRAAGRASAARPRRGTPGSAAGSPVSRPSHTRDIASSSVGPARAPAACAASSARPARTLQCHELLGATARRRRRGRGASARRRACGARLGRARGGGRAPRRARVGSSRRAAPARRRLRGRARTPRRRTATPGAVVLARVARRARRDQHALMRPSSSLRRRGRAPHLARADRLHRLVLGLQANVVGLLEEPLHRRLLPHHRHDDLAVLRRVLPADDHDSRPAGCRRSSSTRRARAAGTRRPRRRRSPGSARSPRCSPRPAAADPRPRGRATECPTASPRTSRRPPPSVAVARSSNSIARGFDGSRRSSPTFSRFARCACTVDDDASPTALPMSRTVGG